MFTDELFEFAVELGELDAIWFLFKDKKRGIAITTNGILISSCDVRLELVKKVFSKL